MEKLKTIGKYGGTQLGFECLLTETKKHLVKAKTQVI